MLSIEVWGSTQTSEQNWFLMIRGISNLRNSIYIQPLSWLLHSRFYSPDFVRGYSQLSLPGLLSQTYFANLYAKFELQTMVSDPILPIMITSRIKLLINRSHACGDI